MSVRLDGRTCRRRDCRQPVRFAVSAATGAWILLDDDDVEPGTRGALILIGDTAFSKAPAIAHLAGMFELPDGEAYTKALTEYGWHLPHTVTCRRRR